MTQIRFRVSIGGCLLAFGTFLASPGLAVAAIPGTERTALTALYTSTNGAAWTARTNWRNVGDTDFNTTGTECTWYGVTCDAGQTRVTSIQLNQNHLTGSIPAELDNLTSLQNLSLYVNELTGPIPARLGNLANLQNLYLHSNQLTGSIPPELGNLSSLTGLNLSSNQLTGPIPPQLGNLPRLFTLYLDGNRLVGSIPPQLGSLISLRFLSLGGNLLAGSIPPALGNLTNLQYLWLSSNQLTGSIPLELTTLTNLEHLGLFANRLTGSIPPELGHLTNLRGLQLEVNQLTGSIPPQLGGLTNLQLLNLCVNQLTGTIPAELGDITNLQSLYLSSNQLTGSIPAELGNLAHLQRLLLEKNQLTGALPSQLSNLTSLAAGYLDLRWNALHTNDAALRTFLNSKQAGNDWQGTQTIAPTGVAVVAPGTWSVALSWTPILYKGDSGGYRVYTSPASGGPYTLWGTTGSKSDSSVSVTGLSASTTYSFVLETITNAHPNNLNNVVSERSAEVVATTLPVENLTVTRVGTGSGTVTSSPAGIDCGATCSAGFAHGPVVTLTATPAVGSAFTGWGGACTGAGTTCQVTMDGPKAVSAVFTQVAGYYTVPPCRVFDSRDGALGGPDALAAGSQPAVAMAGHCGISPTAKTVSLNVTVTTPTAAGHLTLFPDGRALSVVSTINYELGQTRANSAVAALGTSGALRVFVGQTTGSVHVILDVNGYFEQ